MYNIGVIGAGMIAENHIQNLQKTGKVTITWINARTQASIDKVAKKYNIPNKTTDYKDRMIALNKTINCC